MTTPDFPFLEATLMMEGEVIWRIPSTFSIRTCFPERFVRADMDRGTLILDLIPYQTTVRLYSEGGNISCNCTGPQTILLHEWNSRTNLTLTVEPNDLQDTMGIITSRLNSTPCDADLSPARSSLISSSTPSKTSSPGPFTEVFTFTPCNSVASAAPTSLLEGQGQRQISSISEGIEPENDCSCSMV